MGFNPCPFEDENIYDLPDPEEPYSMLYGWIDPGPGLTLLMKWYF